MFPAHRLLALAALAGLPGCATVTSGISQNVSVVTDPPGAVCQFQRGGEVVAVVNPTPGTAWIYRSGRDMAIECARPGSITTLVQVPARFQALTVGNLIYGGIIGLAVDAASGAMSIYPGMVTITLPPERFASAAERDAFFAARTAEVLRQHAERLVAAEHDCQPPTREVCLATTAALTAQRDADLARVEAQRGLARIEEGAAGPPAAPPPRTSL